MRTFVNDNEDSKLHSPPRYAVGTKVVSSSKALISSSIDLITCAFVQRTFEKPAANPVPLG